MSRVIEIFYELSNIPRCSKNQEPFIRYLEAFARMHHYTVQTDSRGNVLIAKPNGNPKICLQSHYDMVCLGDDEENKTFIPDIYEADGYLKAANSTLGADNGIGCAYMLSLIEQQYDIEALFTSDEEIGLLGASALKLSIQSENILNLDSEEEGQIFIGCAGGADIKAEFSLTKTHNPAYMYTLELDEQEGGHSGVDIDKEIPNAIKLLIQFIKKQDLKIIDINGGERINSIPKFCRATICAQKPLASDLHEQVQIKAIEPLQSVRCFDDRLMNLIFSFSQGVRGYDQELSSVLSSINLASIKTENATSRIEFSARAMDQSKLDQIVQETRVLLTCFGFEAIEISGKYKPWKPQKNNAFASTVKKAYEEYFDTVTYEAIHAGLECAVLKDKFPHANVASIGPNIYFPHSFKEEVEISSVHKVYAVIKGIIKKISGLPPKGKAL